MEKTWQPNQKQKDFLKVLEQNPNGLTLAEASEKIGYEIKSGSVNTLVAREIVETEDTEFSCLIVREDNKKVVGHCKKKVKNYRLVRKD